jgi:hypothetical protein
MAAITFAVTTGFAAWDAHKLRLENINLRLEQEDLKEKFELFTKMKTVPYNRRASDGPKNQPGGVGKQWPTRPKKVKP